MATISKGVSHRYFEGVFILYKGGKPVFGDKVQRYLADQAFTKIYLRSI